MSNVAEKNEVDLNLLTRAAESLATAIDGDASRLSDEAANVVQRLHDRRFDIAVVGEFNRGKSTLVNLLLDRHLSPSGVLPVTATLVELSYGKEEKAHVTYLDGTDEVVDLAKLHAYVSEEENPGNKLNIDSVKVTVPAEVLRQGAVLVDTPGVSSIFRHNTETAREAVQRADAAIVVLSADSPITDAERSLIKALSRRSEKTFFVLNRIDHLQDEAERSKVIWFVESVLEEAFGESQVIYPLSARTKEGYEAFTSVLTGFLNNELDQARMSLARRDLMSLADKVDDECALEESALSLTSSELEEKLDHFKRALGWQQEAYDDDKVLFRHATDRMLKDLNDRLTGAAVADAASLDRLRRALDEAPAGDVLSVAEKTLDTEVRNIIEPLRRREENSMEETWGYAAERFEKATHRRSEKLRAIAGELFDVDLKPVLAKRPSSVKGQFFYSPPEAIRLPGNAFQRLFAAFGSSERRKARLIEAAEAHLTAELQRHVERMRADLVARVHEANTKLEEEMAERVEELSSAMSNAIQRGLDRRNANDEEQRTHAERTQRLTSAVTAARDATGANGVVDIRD